MKLNYIPDAGVYTVSFTEVQRPLILRSGFQFSKELKRWVTSRPSVAYQFINFAGPKTKEKILSELGLRFGSCDVDKIIHPDNMTPYEHQLNAVLWMLSRDASYINYEMGLGKTATAPMAINSRPGKAIITCPAFLKYNWETELDLWLTEPLTVQTLHKRSDKRDPEADIYILPDSLVGDEAIRNEFLCSKYEYLFIDEAHRFKSDTAKRTASLLGGQAKVNNRRTYLSGLAKLCKTKVAFSGTPMPNGRPIELYPLVHSIAPHATNYLSKHEFAERYCAAVETQWGWDYNGTSNAEELHELLHRDFMLTETLEDCVSLPEKIEPEFIYIKGGEKNKEAMRFLSRPDIGDLINDLATKYDVIRDKLGSRPELGPLAYMSQLRKYLGLEKVPESVSIIKDMLDSTDKLLVFCWHKEVAEALHSELKTYGAIKVTGDTPSITKQNYVNAFQNDKSVRVMIANIQAAGVGFTLTASSTVVFVEPSWSPSDNDQAIARCRRIGQTRPVTPFYIVAKGSLDNLILNAHQNKSQSRDLILTNQRMINGNE